MCLPLDSIFKPELESIKRLSLRFHLDSNLFMKWNRNLLKYAYPSLEELEMALTATQTPPYVSHRTLTTFLESLRPGIPDRIDGSVFDASFSGTSRKQVTSALKSLGLVDDDLRPSGTLEVLVKAEGEDRRAAWRALLEEVYAPLFQLDLESATPFQLREALRNMVGSESMLVKCESFFKHAAIDAGVRLSPHIMKRKQVRRRRKTEPRQSRPDDSADGNGTARQPVGAPERSSDAYGSNLAGFADKILQKYPEFDPNWSEEARENWHTGTERLMDAFIRRSMPSNDDDHSAS